jgi:hypothetical protein
MIAQANPKPAKAGFDTEPWQQTLVAAKKPACFEYCRQPKEKWKRWQPEAFVQSQRSKNHALHC